MTNFIEYYRKKEDTDTNSIIFERVNEEDIKICGKTLQETITILKGLSLERQLDIQMTMSHLNELFGKLKEIEDKQFKEYLDRQIEQFLWRT